MWKKFLSALIESFACVDPMVYLCYLAANRQLGQELGSAA
jgi:hypothetical protein